MSMDTNKLAKLQSVDAADNQQAEIDLVDLFGFYMSRWPLLVAAVLIGAIVAGTFTYFLIPDRFTAVSRMYMVSASSDSVVSLADLNIGTSLSSDYVELMQSRPVIEDVIDKLELEYSYEQMLGMINLSVVPNTRIVKISVTSTDPREAMEIANQLARTSKVQLPKVMEAPTPSIAEPAILPTRRSSPSLSKNVAIGSLLALMAVLGVLTALYLLDDTIKTSEDLDKVLGIMPLSLIPEGKIGEKRSDEETDDKKPRKKSNPGKRRKGTRE